MARRFILKGSKEKKTDKKKQEMNIIYDLLKHFFNKRNGSFSVDEISIILNNEFQKEYDKNDIISCINNIPKGRFCLMETTPGEFSLYERKIPVREIKNFLRKFFEKDQIYSIVKYSYTQIRTDFINTYKDKYKTELPDKCVNTVIRSINEDSNSGFYLIKQANETIIRISKQIINSFITRPIKRDIIKKELMTQYDIDIKEKELEFIISHIKDKQEQKSHSGNHSFEMNHKETIISSGSVNVVKKTKEDVNSFLLDFFEKEIAKDHHIFSYVKIKEIIRHELNVKIQKEDIISLINENIDNKFYLEEYSYFTFRIYRRYITKNIPKEELKTFCYDFFEKSMDNYEFYFEDIKFAFRKKFNSDITMEYFINTINNNPNNKYYLMNGENDRINLKKKIDLIYESLINLFEKSGSNYTCGELKNHFKEKFDVVINDSILESCVNNININPDISFSLSISPETKTIIFERKQISGMIKSFLAQFFESKSTNSDNVYTYDEINEKYTSVYSSNLRKTDLINYINVWNNQKTTFYLSYSEQLSGRIIKITEKELISFMNKAFYNHSKYTFNKIKVLFKHKYGDFFNETLLNTIIEKMNNNLNYKFYFEEISEGVYNKCISKKEKETFLEALFESEKSDTEIAVYSYNEIQKKFKNEYNTEEEIDIGNFIEDINNKCKSYRIEQLPGRVYIKLPYKKYSSSEKLIFKTTIPQIMSKESLNVVFNYIPFINEYLNRYGFVLREKKDNIGEYIITLFDMDLVKDELSKLLREKFLKEEIGFTWEIEEVLNDFKKRYDLKIDEKKIKEGVKVANIELMDICIIFHSENKLQSRFRCEENDTLTLSSSEEVCLFCKEIIDKRKILAHISEKHMSEKDYCSILKKSNTHKFYCYHCNKEYPFNIGMKANLIFSHIRGNCNGSKQNQTRHSFNHERSYTVEYTNNLNVGSSFTNNTSFLGGTEQMFRENGKYGSFPDEDSYDSEDYVY